MASTKNKEESFVCPVGRFFSEIDKIGGRKSKFFNHINKSKMEFLKAIKSLVDEKIEDLEKKGAKKTKKKATKINVE
jgi:hypothetical protein